MKRVFICSPFASDPRKNTQNALMYCRAAVLKGYAPYAPHVYLPQALDDNKPEERVLGMLTGMCFLDVCDELWAFYDEAPSEGMRLELHYAEAHGKPIKLFHSNGSPKINSFS